jgi:hypothetical protein
LIPTGTQSSHAAAIKSGGSAKLFYRQLIDKADARFDAQVERTRGKRR